MAERVVDKVDEALKADIMHWAAFYVRFSRRLSHNMPAENLNFKFLFQEVRMRTGNKKIYHLEAWVIKVMSLYKVSTTIVHICPCLDIISQHFFFNIDMSEFD